MKMLDEIQRVRVKGHWKGLKMTPGHLGSVLSRLCSSVFIYPSQYAEASLRTTFVRVPQFTVPETLLLEHRAEGLLEWQTHGVISAQGSGEKTVEVGQEWPVCGMLILPANLNS